MKVLAVNGSHRKGKNTAAMLQYVLEGAAAAGAETELLELVDYDIKYCLSCNRCLGKNECTIKDDDMGMLAEKMLAADAIVLGSPVYFSNVTARMKNFMDRSRWLHMCCNMLHGKVGAAVTHAGLRNGGQETTVDILTRFMLGHGMIVVDSRDQDGAIYNLGAMGTMFQDMKDGAVAWRKGVHDDAVAVRDCKALGRNIVNQLNRLVK